MKSIEKFEKNLDIELEKLNDLLGKLSSKTDIENENSSLITFLNNKKKINIDDRIKFYHIIHKYINNIKDSVNCFNISITNSKKEIYKIGKRIILDKKIGDESKYGITFISHFDLGGNNILNKYLIFATKLTDFKRPKNIIEYEILKYLTKLNIDNICPHFPIGYGALICKKSQNDIINKLLQKKILGTELYNIDHIFIFNELADGSLKQLKDTISFDILINAIEQCILSIMFFNKYINAYHNDCHYGNFLYHKIDSGGYFHYNIYGTDYYIENIGYLWVIWDYGLVVPYYNSNKVNKNKFGVGSSKLLSIIRDYKKFINSIISIIISLKYYNPLPSLILKYLLKYNNITDVNEIKKFTIGLLNLLTMYSKTFKTSINSSDSKIINKKPYIIN